jgi:phage FluMu protein Com
VSGVRQERRFDVDCPHCHKSFAAEPIEGGRAARYLGFKCPHCKLFVPLQRATESAPLEPLTRDPDGARPTSSRVPRGHAR